MRWRIKTKTLWVLAAAAASLPALGGSTSSSLSVNITLSGPASGAVQPPASGVCTSAALSDATGAVVRVVCESGQFVSISPQPGGRFIDTHGGAYEFYRVTGASALGPSGDARTPSGTVASFRVYSLEHTGERLEVLVSF
ncbi:MAG TPA: hypothetical protein VFJ70_04910 [Burkholderiales bacterium]|nr:hypothetical protein [Burkholderiales bacterium]